MRSQKVGPASGSSQLTSDAASVCTMLWAASLCLLLASSVLAAPTNKPRQKVLLISFDGFRWDYDRDVDTPNLDKMAVDGVKALYVTPPYLTITSPTHFTLLTGKVFHFLQQCSPVGRGSAYHGGGNRRTPRSEFTLEGLKKATGKKELVVIECPRVQQLL